MNKHGELDNMNIVGAQVSTYLVSTESCNWDTQLSLYSHVEDFKNEKPLQMRVL